MVMQELSSHLPFHLYQGLGGKERRVHLAMSNMQDYPSWESFEHGPFLLVREAITGKALLHWQFLWCNLLQAEQMH